MDGLNVALLCSVTLLCLVGLLVRFEAQGTRSGATLHKFNIPDSTTKSRKSFCIMAPAVPQVDRVAQEVLFRVQATVDGQHLQAIREALLGGESEMLHLLSSLPGYPVSALTRKKTRCN